MALTVDLIIEDKRWVESDLQDWADKAASGIEAAPVQLPADAELAILACDDKRIKELNVEFRDKSKPTNVLSWPTEDLASEEAGGLPDPATDPELGDIAIAFETCVSEAADQSKTLENHVIHLIVHAILHLLGFDHIEDADAQRMETLEVEILAKLNISNPYVE